MLINTQVLDKVSAQAEGESKLRHIYPLHHSPEANSQRMLHAMEPGVQMPIHRHTHMDQSYIILRGKIRVMFYDDASNITQDFVLCNAEGNYGLNIPMNQWHCLEVLEAHSVLFEANDGPARDLPAQDIMT